MATVDVSRNELWRSRLQPWLCLGLIVTCFVLTLLSSPLVSVGTWNEFDVDMFGWLIFVCGAAMRWWSALYRTVGQPPQLAMSGPYSVCRHPTQLGNLLFCISLACFLSSLTCLLGFAVAAIGYLSLTIPAEEQKLREVFGEQYDRYCQSVPRLWPRLRLFQTPENIGLDIGTLAHELRRTAVWMWLPVLGKAAAQCRAEIWWPHLFGLP
jgi:protein-S-isoprenylcysteine O-methyltransferase Ste14